MAYEFVSTKKTHANAGRPKGKGAYILVYKQEDVAVCTRDVKGVRVTAFSFLEGKKPIGIYHVPSTQNVFQTTSGDSGSRGYIHNADFEIPGLDIAVDEFMENNQNEELGAIAIPCDGSDCKMAGTKCTPLEIVQDNTEDSAKKRSHSVQLKSIIPGSVIGHMAKHLVPVTDDAAVNAILGLPYTGASDGDGI